MKARYTAFTLLLGLFLAGSALAFASGPSESGSGTRLQDHVRYMYSDTSCLDGLAVVEEAIGSGDQDRIQLRDPDQDRLRDGSCDGCDGSGMIADARGDRDFVRDRDRDRTRDGSCADCIGPAGECGPQVQGQERTQARVQNQNQQVQEEAAQVQGQERTQARVQNQEHEGEPAGAQAQTGSESPPAGSGGPGGPPTESPGRGAAPRK